MDNTQHQTNKGNELLARLDRLSGWPYPWYVLPIVGVAFFFSFYDIVNIAFAIPPIMHQFHCSQSTADWTITGSLIGYIIGSFIDARISDRFGRRVSLFISIFMYSLGALLCATATNIGLLIAWRVITGMGLGAEIACSVSYVSEIAPKEKRGFCVALSVACGYLGFAVTPFIALAILPNLYWGWRLLFIIGCIGAVIFFFLRLLIPNSPRWLVQHGELEKAETVVIQAEAAYQTKTGKPLPEIPPLHDAQIQIEHNFSLWHMLNSGYFKRLCLFVLIWLFYYIGNYGWLTLNDSLLRDLGFIAITHRLLLISVQSIGFIVGSLVSIYYIDRFERKWFACTLGIIWTLSLLVIGWYPQQWTILLFGFIASASISSIIPIMYTYTAENYPTAFRTTGVSLSDGLGHIGGAFCGQIVFAFYALFSTPHASFAAAFTTMAVTGLIASGLLALGNKTTSRSLSHTGVHQNQSEY